MPRPEANEGGREEEKRLRDFQPAWLAGSTAENLFAGLDGADSTDETTHPAPGSTTVMHGYLCIETAT
jgi:hypothetical protein